MTRGSMSAAMHATCGRALPSRAFTASAGRTRPWFSGKHDHSDRPKSSRFSGHSCHNARRNRREAPMLGLWTDLPWWARLGMALVVMTVGIVIVVRSIHSGAAPTLLVDDLSRYQLLVGF